MRCGTPFLRIIWQILAMTRVIGHHIAHEIIFPKLALKLFGQIEET
jgi:hypothetical protein